MATVGACSLGRLRTWSSAGVLAGALTFFGGVTHGQQYAQIPSYQQQEFSRTIEESMRRANEWNQSRTQDSLRWQEHLDKAGTDVNAVLEKNWENLTTRLMWFGVVALGVGCILVLGFAMGLFVHLRTTTDPQKLAMSDPWLRAQMSQLDAAAIRDRTSDSGHQEST